MASAVHGMGFTEEATLLALEGSMSGRTVVIFERAVQVVRKLCKKTNLVLKKVLPTGILPTSFLGTKRFIQECWCTYPTVRHQLK
jgi:hypothetical protein